LTETTPTPTHHTTGTVRVATFNTSLHRARAGQLRDELTAAVAAGGAPAGSQLGNVLEIIRATGPDVLVVNELDTGTDGDPVAVSHLARLASYDHWFTAPSNTGLPSGCDLDGDGVDDPFAFGAFPGQFGMAVLSRHPIDRPRVRTFQTLRWADMPGALLPVDPATGRSWYPDEALAVLRLSSKSHWDVPIDVGWARDLHLLVSHPTPPAFDGPERRNSRRNFDEIRFWADYITPGSSAYISDDAGRRGGLDAGAWFVIAGDQNSDPSDGGSVPGAIQQLLGHPDVNTTLAPHSLGAVEAAGGRRSAGRDPRFDTADFPDPPGGPGNLRVDYVLPAVALDIVAGAVFWPRRGEPGAAWTGAFPFPSSDHRLVWLDVVAR
jgi:hypothetical protein